MTLIRFALVSLVLLPAAHAQSPSAVRVMPVTPLVAVPPPAATPITQPVVTPTLVPGPKLVVAPPVVRKPDWAGKPGTPRLTPLDDVRPSKRETLSDKSEMEQMKLQETTQQKSRNAQTMSEVMKKSSDSAQGIIQNLK